MFRRSLATLTFLLLLAPLAAAQSLAPLLPAETLLAVGITDLDQHAGLLDDFVTEFESRGVGEALGQVFGDLEEDAGELDAEIPPALQGLGFLDVAGQDAWLAVSASPFNPIPAVTLAARMSAEATAAFGDMIADAAAEPDVQELSEGGVTFWVVPLDAPDAPVQAVAFTQTDGITLASSNPDVLRGVLRRLGGSGEPGFGDSDGYARTLGRLGSGNLAWFLDLGTVAEVVAPFTQGMGFGPQVERFQRALATAGANAGVTWIEPDGLASETILAPDPDGGDVGLFNLLTANGQFDAGTLQFVPATALTASSGYVDLTGWWNYLNDLVGSLPDLGIESLDQAVRDMAGIDLRATFFGWTGTHAATITTGVADAAQPGMTASNLLGEQVYVVETIDEAGARQGLSMLFGTIASTVAAFADPAGGAGAASIGQETVAGVTVDTYEITPGVRLATAVTGGYALIATSPEAMQAALGASADGANLPPVFADLLAQAPSGARTVGLSDTRALTEATARQYADLIQLGAGFGGAADLDFDAVTQASETVEGYLLFVASRLGGSVSASQLEDQTIRSRGHTVISW